MRSNRRDAPTLGQRPVRPYSRAAATTYLVTLPCMVLGVLFGVVRYATNIPEYIVGLVVVFLGALVLTALAHNLDRSDPLDAPPAPWRSLSMRRWQIYYHRLALGLEIPRAWQTFVGRDGQLPRQPGSHQGPPQKHC